MPYFPNLDPKVLAEMAQSTSKSVEEPVAMEVKVPIERIEVKREIGIDPEQKRLMRKELLEKYLQAKGGGNKIMIEESIEPQIIVQDLTLDEEGKNKLIAMTQKRQEAQAKMEEIAQDPNHPLYYDVRARMMYEDRLGRYGY